MVRCWRNLPSSNMMKIYASSQAKEAFAILAKELIHAHTHNQFQFNPNHAPHIFMYVYGYRILTHTQIHAQLSWGWNDENIKTNQKMEKRFLSLSLFHRISSVRFLVVRKIESTNALMALRKFDFLPWAKLLLLLLLCARPTIRQRNTVVNTHPHEGKKRERDKDREREILKKPPRELFSLEWYMIICV